MKLRYLVILGVLVFFNGFIFTVLLLMASREFARPASTPTELSTATATIPEVPSPTTTGAPLPTATNTGVPISTNTMVVVEPTPTQTLPPATATVSTPTATTPPVAPTATPVPATATPTATATATPTPSWDFEYVADSMHVSANCAGPYFEGVILGQGGSPTDGISVHFWFYNVPDCKVSGEGKPTGEWGFNPGLAENLKNTHIEFYLQVVDNCTNLAPRSAILTIPFDSACEAGQFENITFQYTR